MQALTKGQNMQKRGKENITKLYMSRYGMLSVSMLCYGMLYSGMYVVIPHIWGYKCKKDYLYTLRYKWADCGNSGYEKEMYICRNKR
jgi:hypothetical protein